MVLRKPVNIEGLVLCQEDISGPTRAIEWVRKHMRDCPHMVLQMYDANNPERVVSVVAVPPDKVWWVTALAEDPSLIGATEVKVTLFGSFHPQELLMPDYDPPVPVPCDAECDKCPQYGKRCKGCPVSRFFLG